MSVKDTNKCQESISVYYINLIVCGAIFVNKNDISKYTEIALLGNIYWIPKLFNYY